MARWRRLGCACAAVLAAAEYSWLSVIDQAVPPLPHFLWPVQALLFSAAVAAMLGTITFVVLLLYALARGRPTRPDDYVVAVLCIGLMVAVLHW